MTYQYDPKRFPDSPGVYIMRDEQGGAIYIGKALSLKKRLASYFSSPQNAKNAVMLSNLTGIDFTVVKSEPEALLLEMRLIKKFKPRFNVSFKDDKGYPFVKITAESFPTICISRKKKKDNAEYLGPFTSVKLLKQALKIARPIFPFRSCPRMPKTPCLYYRINSCPGPCAGKITPRQYRGIIKNLRLFLEGRYEQLLAELSSKMHALARRQRFEEAARLRDEINALGAVSPGSGLIDQRRREMEMLKNALGLRSLPRRIEAFDISNIMEESTVGSMVSFLEGLPDKDNYRRFKIKTVLGVNDYAMLREVVRRRYVRLIKDGTPCPDLIIIDGGKGHLSSAQAVLEELGLGIPVISIAKSEERIYLSGQDRPLGLERCSVAMHLLMRVRDEAHRFALSYNRLLRRKKVLGS